MIVSLLLSAVLAWAADDAGPSPGELIGRLGSERFDDRVEAYQALERLGGDALPALRAAADAADPRVRSRVRALLESLGRRAEADRVTSPTMVRLDFRDRPLGEVIDTLNGRHDLLLALQLGPAPPRGMHVWLPDPEVPRRLAQIRGRTLTLEAPGPMPFWEAIDRICKAASLRYQVAPRLGGVLGQGPFALLADRTGRGPVSDTGPFRVQVTGVHSAFERDLTGDLDPAGQGAGPAGVGDLEVYLAVLPEPGMVLHQTGPLTVVESADDQGRSLPRRVNTGPGLGPGILSVPAGNSRGSILVDVNLVTTDPPGASIRRLRGKVPVVAVVRRPNPLVIPLQGDGSVGKPFRTDDADLVVDQVAIDPRVRASVTVTIRPRRPEPVDDYGLDPSRTDFASFRLDFAIEHLELRDADGRRIPHDITDQSRGVGGNERFLRVKVVARPDPEDIPAGGPFDEPRPTRTPIPAELRFYSYLQTATEVPFDLRDIPIP